MSPLYLFAAELPSWVIWAMPTIAVGSVGLGVVVGRRLYGARPAAPTEFPPPPEDQAEDEDDARWVERRLSPRHKVRQVKVLLSDAAAQTPPFEGWLLNRSLGGLGLSVSRSVDAGTILSVRQAVGNEVTPWVRVEVRYCRMERGRWTLGCKFVDHLPSNSLVVG
jgi:hypothetical protein